jgi:large subunit ribosomal protein L46
MGDQTASLEAQREALVRDAEGRLIPGAEPAGDKEANKEQVSGDAKAGEGQRKDLELHVERPASRVTEADEKNDTLSLNRKLDQTLYLLVQNKEGLWRFPEDRLFAREDLHMVSFFLPSRLHVTIALILTHYFPGRRARHRPIRRP